MTQQEDTSKPADSNVVKFEGPDTNVPEGTSEGMHAAVLQQFLEQASRFIEAGLLYEHVSAKKLTILPGEIPTFAMMAKADFEKSPALGTAKAIGMLLGFQNRKDGFSVTSKRNDDGSVTVSFTLS